MQHPIRRIHALYRLQHIQRRMPQIIFRPVIVDREAYVYSFTNFSVPRQRFRRGVTRPQSHHPQAPARLAVIQLIQLAPGYPHLHLSGNKSSRRRAA